LDEILAAHRREAEADHRDLDALIAAAGGCPQARGFAAALASPRGSSSGLGTRVKHPAVIAEIKRRSPSRGSLAPGLVPGVLAKAYATAGAGCLSVLTDRQFFGGSPGDLAEARTAVGLPVLRKDFTVCAADVCDARLMGADALLLIVAALSPDELRGLLALATSLGLDTLVEVHDEAEAETALDAGATLIGVNQRDLATFEVDAGRAARVAGCLPSGVVKVAESGIRTASDVARLAEAGFDAVLVGEALVTASDPGAALASLVACS